MAQWAVWGGLFGFGLFLPDFGDTSDSQAALLTKVFGYSDGLISLSMTIAALALVVAAVAWIGLLVLQIRGIARGSGDSDASR